jgi:hypothetical protein
MPKLSSTSVATLTPDELREAVIQALRASSFNTPDDLSIVIKLGREVDDEVVFDDIAEVRAEWTAELEGKSKPKPKPKPKMPGYPGHGAG